MNFSILLPVPARGNFNMSRSVLLREGIVDTTSGGFERFLKIFIGLAVLFLAAELVYLLGVMPFRPFSSIDISGYINIPKDEILGAAGLTGNSTYFSTDAKNIEKALQAYSSLESVQVVKQFPDKLKIILESRRPVASALATVNGATIPVLFDSNGVIFQIGGETKDQFPEDTSGLPVISGLVIENPYPGMKLPVMFSSFFEQLEKIEMSAPELLQAVSEIKISPKSFNSFDIVLFPAYKKIRVRLSELNEDMLRYTLLMVDVLASRDPGIDNLDFRSGIASYIPKEASSE